MESCLLCLQINCKLVQRIHVNSVEWQEYDVHNVIEKHLWPVESLQISFHSWLCNLCWQELYNFHKFYKRIEKTQINLSLRAKEATNSVLEHVKDEDNKPNIANFTCVEKNNESEVLNKPSFRNDVVNEGVNTFIKEELQVETSFVEEISPNMGNERFFYVENVVRTTEDPLLEKQIKKEVDVKVSFNKKIKFQKVAKKKNLKTDESKERNKRVKETIAMLTKIKHGVKPSQEGNENYKCNTIESNSTSDNKTQKIADKTAQSNEYDKFIADNFKLTCSQCQITAHTFHDLCQHFKIVHKRNGYVVCCNKKFYRRIYLVEHLHQHIDPNYFKCTICDRVLADRKCLNKHKKTHYKKRQKQHQCDICKKSFTMYLSLTLHKASHVPEEEKHFSCTECYKNFGSKLLLSNHFRGVHKKNNIRICDICGKAIKCKEVFERHMLQHEGKPSTITCDICGLKLSSRKGLKHHKINMHTEGRKQEFNCPVCSKISPNLKALNKHIKYNHDRGYDYKCAICEKAFKTAHSLMEHMASHTGSVLYTCPWCPKTFNSNANFYSHRKKAHPKEWEDANRKKYSDNTLTTNNIDLS